MVTMFDILKHFYRNFLAQVKCFVMSEIIFEEKIFQMVLFCKFRFNAGHVWRSRALKTVQKGNLAIDIQLSKASTCAVSLVCHREI